VDEHDARDRLRREAQAMARLTHPNVVTVYDVATHDSSIFIAMELVEGGTLRDYVRTPRSWRDTLGVCVSAGRGLAAAHGAKLIHRDYKPENVLCGDDGRIVVSDFGLARLDDDRPVVDRAAPATVTTLAGTPAYMAPELARGVGATVASDQFSFSVATYEALYGERPFAGETLEELQQHIAAGAAREVPANTRVPPRILAALRRGFANDPAARFPSMTALLDALEAGRSSRRRFALVGAGVLGLAIAAGVIVARASGSGGPTCELDEAALAGGWDAPHRAALERALAGRTADVVARVTGAFDGYAQSWLATRREACRATWIRGDQSEQVLDARIACLDRGRRELGELATLIAGDPALADKTVEAVYRLRDPQTCTGDPSDIDPATEPARAANDRAGVLLAAGKAQEAISITKGVLRVATAPAVRAEALLIRGRAELLLGQLDAAEASLSEALTAAERARADQLVAAIWVEIVQTTGSQKHRFEAAAANVRAADAAFTRIEPGPALRARYALVVGTMLLAKGKLDDARAQLDRALVANGDARPGERGVVHAALCDVHRQLRHSELARAQCRTAVELLTAAFGANHPKLAPTFNVWGALELDDGKFEAARAHFGHAIEIFESNHLTNDRGRGRARSITPVAWMRGGDVARARPLFERARDLFATYHPDHPQRVLPLQGLASVALELEDYATAIRYYEESLGVIEAVYGKDADARLTVLFNLGLTYQRLPDLDKTIALTDEMLAQAQRPGHEAWVMAANALDLQATIADTRKDSARSVALRERALAALDKQDEPATRAYISGQLGNSLRRSGKPALAVAPLERAVAYYNTDRTDPYQAGIARFSLARALWDVGQRARAIEVAKAARDELATATTGFNLSALRLELAGWLLDRGVK
jgi:tetratricopeptide (TPR) repeat protein